MCSVCCVCVHRNILHTFFMYFLYDFIFRNVTYDEAVKIFNRFYSIHSFSFLSLHCAVLSHLGHVWLFAILRTVIHQTPLSMGFFRQEYWIGLPCPPPGDLLIKGLNPHLLCLLHCQAGSLPLATPGMPSWDIRNIQIFWKDWRRS